MSTKTLLLKHYYRRQGVLNTSDMSSYYLRHSSPLEPPLSAGLGPLSASFDLFDFFFFLSSAGFGVLNAGFGVLSAGFGV